MEILYEDKNILIVNKPFGMPSQKDLTKDMDLLTILNKDHRELFLINRLDRPVGGLVMFAKNSDAAAKLSKQMEEKKITKKYLVAVNGRLEGERELRNYLVKIGRLNISKVVNKEVKNAKEAILSYKNISYNEEEDISYLIVNLITGRHHQIRVQLANIGNFIIGDQKYGKSLKKYDEMGLYSYNMTFNSLEKNEIIEVTGKIPNSGIFKGLSL